MKTIIAGSRSITNYDLVVQAVEKSGFTITEVVSGTARGVDLLGERWAIEHGVPIRQYRPDWDLYKYSAGPIRNVMMANYADALIAVWDGFSRGTQHMIRIARQKQLKVYVFLYPTRKSSDLWEK